MSGVALEPIAQWLLLDGADAARALTTLRQGFAALPSFKLFDGTEFEPVSEHGPVLVDMRDSPALASLCHTDPDTWRGLLMDSEVSPRELLSHLQRMLTVSFGMSHRALLSYYNRQTASYFFDACDAAELSRWLGPIRLLHWFGGTWADRAIGSQGWQQLRNPGLAVEPLSIEESLTRRQCERLQTCLLEQHIWRWCQSLGTDYAAMASHVQQGLALGFSDRTVLEGWLWLRLQHPRAVLVPPPQDLTQQERLDHLRRQWRSDQI